MSRLLFRGVFYDCLQKALGNDVTEESFDEQLGGVCMLGVGCFGQLTSCLFQCLDDSLPMWGGT